MVYVQDIDIVDLKSGVGYLIQKFSTMAFDAYHEAVYGMGWFMVPSKFSSLSDRYNSASYVCEEYLAGEWMVMMMRMKVL